MRLRKGKLIPRDDGKRIEEFVGAANTKTRSVSVARMWAPPGWSEPPQKPEFDEVVMVLKGTLTLLIDGKREKILANEVGFVPRGRKVVYRNDQNEGCDYFSVCAPAFLPELAHVEPAQKKLHQSRVLVDSSHPRAKSWAAKVRKQALAYLQKLDLGHHELSVSLVGDQAIRRLNRTWRNKDKATDVLSFPAGDLPKGTPGPKPLGDVVISLDTAARVAKEDGRSMDAEVARYLAHGILHLLGYDHERSKADARRMAALEELLLGETGLIPSDSTSAGRKREARRS